MNINLIKNYIEKADFDENIIFNTDINTALEKSISNNLSNLGFSKDFVKECLKKVGKTELARAEEFSVQGFIDFIGILEG